MTVPGQICPLHAGEWPTSVRLPDGGTAYTCERSDHPAKGPYRWLEAPPPPPGSDLDGIAADLSLEVELPAAVAVLGGDWVEYGLVERAYAAANPEDFAFLVARYGHRALRPAKRYSASAFLAACLGRYGREGAISYHDGPATAGWAKLGQVSWWAPALPPAWSTQRTCTSEGVDFDYVPGAPARAATPTTDAAR